MKAFSHISDPKRRTTLESRVRRVAPHLLDWNGQGHFPGWFRNAKLPNETRTFVDPGYVAHFQKRLREGKNVPSSIQALAATKDQVDKLLKRAYGEFAGVGNYQRSTATQLPMGLSYTQAEFIGPAILREFVGGLDLKAEYPVYGTEAFEVIGSTKKPFGAKSDRVDINVAWETVTCDQHHKETTVEDAERAAGAWLPQGIDTTKANVLLSQLRTEKEIDVATLVATTSQYASGYSETPTGADMWDHQDSDPLTDILDAKNVVRRGTRERPKTFWSGEDVLYKLQRNPKIVESIKYTGTKLSPGSIVPVEGLVAMLMMDILTGSAGAITTAGGSIADIWAQDAGLINNSMDPMAQRFGILVTTLGYPDSREYREEQIGTKGATVIKQSDAWKAIRTNNKGGYLWKQAVTAPS